MTEYNGGAGGGGSPLVVVQVGGDGVAIGVVLRAQILGEPTLVPNQHGRVVVPIERDGIAARILRRTDIGERGVSPDFKHVPRVDGFGVDAVIEEGNGFDEDIGGAGAIADATFVELAIAGVHVVADAVAVAVSGTASLTHPQCIEGPAGLGWDGHVVAGVRVGAEILAVPDAIAVHIGVSEEPQQVQQIPDAHQSILVSVMHIRQIVCALPINEMSVHRATQHEGRT